MNKENKERLMRLAGVQEVSISIQSQLADSTLLLVWLNVVKSLTSSPET